MTQELTLAFVGDLMMGRLVDAALTRHGLRHVWGNIQPLMSGGLGRNQVVAGNLECAVTAHWEKYEKEFNFKLSPSNIRVLKMAGVDYLSLANNHSMDFMVPGLQETQRILEDTGIAYSGVGRKREAMAPVYLQKADHKIAFFSFADHYAEWAATESEIGINYINPMDYDLESFKQQVQIAREEKGVSMIIVFIHWGPNWGWHPSVNICNLAHDFVEAGVDLIFGHSAHHIQGIEVFKGAPIIYGAGGFVDDYAVDKEYRNDLGFLYVIRIKDERIGRIDLIPTKVDHVPQAEGETPAYISKINKATGEDYSWLGRKITQLCRFFGTKIEDRGEEHGMTIKIERQEMKVFKKNTPKQFTGM